MNKKIFTLAAAFGLAASSFTAGAAGETPVAKDKFYRITSSTTVNGSETYLGVDVKNTDSLVYAKKATLVANIGKSGEDDILSDRFFWSFEPVYTTPGADASFKITNKATGAVLALNVPTGTSKEGGKTGKESSAIIAKDGALNVWSFSNANDTRTGEGNNTAHSIVASDSKGNIWALSTIDVSKFFTGTGTSVNMVGLSAATAYTSGTATLGAVSGSVLNAFVAAAVNTELTVEELNALKAGSGFDLSFTSFDKVVTPAVFAGKTLQAFGVKGSSVVYTVANTTTATLTITASSDIAFDATEAAVKGNKKVFLATGKTVKNGAGQTVKYFAVVDTAYIAGTKQYVFTEDTIGVAKDGKSLVAAKGRDLASYLFSMSKNYEDDKVGLYPIAVPTPPAEDEYWSDKATSDFVTAPTENDMEMATAITTTAAYIAKFDNVSILTLGKVSDLANDESYKNSKITFNQGTAVENLNTKVAYNVQPTEDNKAVSGKYYVAGNVVSASTSDYIPSTQWGLKSDGGSYYTLYNRETGATLTVGGVSATGMAYDVDAANNIYKIGGLTVALVARADVKGENVGYKEFSDSDVKFKKIALKLNTFGTNPVYLALKSDKDSVVVASENEANKIEFKLVANESKAFGNADNDSLVRTSYALKSGDLYLAYDYNLQSYKLSKLLNGGNMMKTDGTPANEASPVPAAANDTVFVYFQNVGKDVYALVPERVYTSNVNMSASTLTGAYGEDYGVNFTATDYSADGAAKRLEFGIYTQKLVVNSNGTVKNVDFGDSMNSSFAIEDGTPEYDKTIQKPAHQTITLSTDKAMALTITSDNFAAMKRVGQELKADYAADNLKMYVDTATMADVNKPLYYITTGQNVPAECQAKGERNYLISLQDSSKVEGYTSEGLSRVGFVHGVVEADTITLFKGHTVAADTVVIKNNHANVANWAFTANEDGSVSLENQKKGEFIAFRNDVLVMVGSLEEAAQFTMEAVEAPTANDAAPSVTEVKVIAANGAIQVIGAQGKKVVVSNILGQTIANTILTSSDATIAAPAGIVVVAVEGEEAVKAIVK